MTKKKVPQIDVAALLADMTPIETAEVVKRLGSLAGILERQALYVNRRHGWSPAERAAAIADILKGVQAVRHAAAMVIAHAAS